MEPAKTLNRLCRFSTWTVGGRLGSRLFGFLEIISWIINPAMINTPQDLAKALPDQAYFTEGNIALLELIIRNDSIHQTVNHSLNLRLCRMRQRPRGCLHRVGHHNNRRFLALGLRARIPKVALQHWLILGFDRVLRLSIKIGHDSRPMVLRYHVPDPLGQADLFCQHQTIFYMSSDDQST